MKNSKKTKVATKKGTIRNRIIAMVMVLLVLSNVYGCGCSRSSDYVVEDYFVKYENATTLVEVQFGERDFLTGYKKVCGFIDNNIYEQYMDNNYEGVIQIYHPYKDGESVTVNTKTIVLMTLYTYDSFCEEFPPSRSGN